MNSLEKWMILTPLQKMPNNVGDLGKTSAATSFEWLPKVQKIAKSGHTGLQHTVFQPSPQVIRTRTSLQTPLCKKPKAEWFCIQLTLVANTANYLHQQMCYMALQDKLLTALNIFFTKLSSLFSS